MALGLGSSIEHFGGMCCEFPTGPVTQGTRGPGPAGVGRAGAGQRVLEEAPALGGGMVFGGGTQSSEGPGDSGFCGQEPALWPLGVLLWAWPSGEPRVRVRQPSASHGLSQTAAASRVGGA